MKLIISYPLLGLHNLAYSYVNPTMVNGYDEVHACKAMDFIGKAQFEKKKKKSITLCSWYHICLTQGLSNFCPSDPNFTSKMHHDLNHDKM